MILLIASVGITFTLIFLIIGLFGNKKIALKRAATTLFLTIVLVIIFTDTEIDFTNSKSIEDKDIVFVASREAPLGGIALTLYADTTFSLNNIGNYELTGKYNLSGDTLFIESNEPKKYLKNGNATAFLIHKWVLEDIKDSGILFLDIKKNNLK